MRRVERRVWTALGAAVGMAALAAGLSLALRDLALRREAIMRAAASAAGGALRDARGEDAMHWAPGELATAERAAREALTRQRVEEVRAWPIPDAAPVVDAWSAAERAARAALGAARDRRAASATSATEQIELARQAIAGAETLAETIFLGRDRRLLATARTSLDQARAYQRAGDLATAAARARDAESLADQVRDRAAGLASRFADAETQATWRRWKNETIAWSKREGRPAILVVKDTHEMTVFLNGQAVKRYKVELGFNWIVDKRQEGDGATPEGRYRVVSRIEHAGAEFHKALLIDYPNAEDRARFGRGRRDGGLPAFARIGGLIEIHGGGGRQRDWTNGCVAVTNAEIEDLFRRVGVGTPVTIVGSESYGPIAELADRQKRDAAARH
jgi:murein L,D-transpeptidase YafK